MNDVMKLTAATMTAALLVGCGGSNSPLLGTGQSPRIRTLNLTPSATLTSEYNSSSNPIGSMAPNQLTSYETEGEGSNTVIFLSGGNSVASDTSVYQYSDYYTVSAYTKNGQYGTFAVTDNNIALDNGTSQIRGVNADTTVSQNMDVYVTPGSFANPPTLVAGNLISNPNGGLAFGTATAYKSETPGTYTVTCTPTGAPGTIWLNQVVTLNGGQSNSVYTLTGTVAVTTVDDEGG